ncbi:DUF4468 domain-containing protein [Chryseobacterium sp.]|uniref:DUF4468 domain-containing protein n=1 Tax=Chryseobacterium sp. TaxID=1871047 RepID=UPI00388E791C
MKKAILLLFLLFSLLSFAQTDEPLKISEVVKVSDSTSTAKQLYSRSKIWFTKVFNNPKYVIQLDDPDNNMVMGRGLFNFSSKIFMGGQGRAGHIKFDVTVSAKDGRYKYEFTNFTHEKAGLITESEIVPGWNEWITGSETFRKKISKELKDYIDTEISKMVITLKAEMDKGKTANDDW